ncbi:MAG: sulfatase [Thermoanaerobaculia bacterium]|nr:sulfatase [Thermoanaerobaculia bacterium]
MNLGHGSARLLQVFVGLGVAWLVGCSEVPEEEALSRGRPRGAVLVSIDTLRADHLGIYGYSRDTSPHLDALARESVVFDIAIAQAPSTLTSHLAMFTSLFPSQFFPTARGPVPPTGHGLSNEIPTFPEIFQEAGFRTAGHTEGGYASGMYGFRRGFEVWTDPHSTSSTDIERTVGRGLDFLRLMADRPDERFLLFLHTYSVHDPYEPPPPFRGMFTSGEPPTSDPASAATLLDVNADRRGSSDAEAKYFAARYDEGIRYADEVLGRLWSELKDLGLDEEIVLVVTADHGEEFLEHGRYLHTQLFPEHLRVPLLVRIPDATPGRVATAVRSIDIAPTLLDVMGLPPLPGASGRSLRPWLASDGSHSESAVAVSAEAPRPVCAETWDSGSRMKMLLADTGEDLIWSLQELPSIDPGGAWISRSAEFDLPFGAAGGRGALRLLAFHQPRTIRLYGSDGVLLKREIPTRWVELDLPEHAEGSRLRIEVDDCVSPSRLGESGDPRCLGVQMARPVLQRNAHFAGFPRQPLTKTRPDALIGRRLEQAFEDCSPPLLAEAKRVQTETADRQALCALGYLSEQECPGSSEP